MYVTVEQGVEGYTSRWLIGIQSRCENIEGGKSECAGRLRVESTTCRHQEDGERWSCAKIVSEVLYIQMAEKVI